MVKDLPWRVLLVSCEVNFAIFFCQLIKETIHDVDSDDGENDSEKEDDEKDG